MTGPLEDVSVNGTTLRARVDGPDGAPMVALVNSLATDHRMWEPQVEALTARYRVLRYDARGHGGSLASKGPYTMDQLADDVLALIDHYGAEESHVVGLSIGGLVAITVGARAPKGVKSVAICDSNAALPPEAQDAIAKRNALVRDKGMAAVADMFMERWFTPETLEAGPPYLAVVRDMILATSVEGFVGASEAIRAGGVREKVPEISVPALFLLGDQDAALPLDVAREMCAEVADGSLAVIAGAGHLSNLEQPAQFNAALLGFLGKI